MKILLVKLSSMGDIFHTYPALSDLKTVFPDASLDWLVDSQFAGIAGWHKGVDRVIGVPHRAARKKKDQNYRQQIRDIMKQVRSTDYDLVIDAQGLLKSALLTRGICRSVCGYSWSSAREPLASLFYSDRAAISKDLHAVDRIRQLFAVACAYTGRLADLPEQGLNPSDWPRPAEAPDRYGLLFPGTTWETKHWVPSHWTGFLEQAHSEENCFIGWGSDEERSKALSISDDGRLATVFDHRLSFEEMAAWIAGASWVVGVDTGFVHLASAFGVPVIGLFGPTSPEHTGVRGECSANLAVRLPCFPCRKKSCRIAERPGQVVCMEKLAASELITESQRLFRN